MLKRLFSAFGRQDCTAEALHGEIVAQARKPALYAAVPDSMDGRFELVLLHACLLFHRLKGGPRSIRELSQAVFDEMFRDFDRALREAGVGDLTVPKRVKDMARIFYTRTAAFDGAFDARDSGRLADAIERSMPLNGREFAPVLAAYAIEAVKMLAEEPDATFLAGRIAWPEPPGTGHVAP